MALYQLNDTDGDSVFLIQTNANEYTLQKIWDANYYTEWESGDELEDAVCAELERQGYTADRTFITEIDPK